MLPQEPTVVPDKATSFRLMQQKAFGNCLQTWNSAEEALRDEYPGELRLRYKGTGGNSKFSIVPFPKPDLKKEMDAWLKDGIPPESIVVCEAGPDNSVRLQGEVWTTEKGLSLAYSTVNGLTCREAMKNPEHAYGLEAIGLLKTHMDPASYDDLQTLLKIYPDSVIEFSTFNKIVGWAKRNTVYWEVRNY